MGSASLRVAVGTGYIPLGAEPIGGFGVWIKQVQAFLAQYTKFNVVKPVPHLTIAAETSFRSSTQARV
jgi:hypothetical protein